METVQGIQQTIALLQKVSVQFVYSSIELWLIIIIIVIKGIYIAQVCKGHKCANNSAFVIIVTCNVCDPYSHSTVSCVWWGLAS